MLCYRCGSHTSDASSKCENCGQTLVSVKKPGSVPTGRAESNTYELGPYKIGDTIALRYQVKNILGMGPSGYVYRVHDTHPGIKPQDAEIALKVVHGRFLQTPIDRDRFSRALAWANKIGHPGLVRVMLSGEDQGHTYYTMPMVRGLSLARAIDMRKGQSPFSLEDAELIVGQVCQILEALHPMGAHGSIRPDNILIQPPGEVKITDAMMIRGLPLKPYFAGLQQQMSYIAPEIRSGDIQQLVPISDVYSLAVVLYEMLTNEKPKTFKIPANDVLLSVYPKEVAELLSEATDTAVDKRTQSVGVFHQRLLQIVRNQRSNTPKEREPADRTVVTHVNPYFAESEVQLPEVQLSVEGNLNKQGSMFWVLAGIVLFVASVVVGTMLYLNQSSFLSLRKGVDLQKIWQRVDVPTPASKPVSQTAGMPTGVASNNTSPPSSLPADAASLAAARGHPNTERVSVRDKQNCMSGMVWIPGEQATPTLASVQSFCMDRYEYPNVAERIPVNQVSYFQAKNLCNKQNKRLCSEEEWERACRGPGQLRYPYADAYEESVCAVAVSEVQASGRYKQCVSGFGLYDMAGNVAEIVESKKGEEMTVKGGSLKSLPDATRCNYRFLLPTGTKSATVGFRCCLDLE